MPASDNARHLWRRIDEGIKAGGSELEATWEVGKLLWKREISAAYAALQRTWSAELAPLATGEFE